MKNWNLVWFFFYFVVALKTKMKCSWVRGLKGCLMEIGGDHEAKKLPCNGQGLDVQIY